MKKIINLFSFLLIINLLILCNLLINKCNNDSLLPIVYAKTSIHNNDNYNLILSILKDTNKNNLIKYADYINLKIIDSLPNDEKDNVYFILSLPENVSFIAIYKKIDTDNYKYQSTIDDLSSIDNLYRYKDFLIIEQSIPNISSKISDNKYFQVFAKEEDRYISVFKKSTYLEKIITNDNSTFKEIEKGSIDCLNGDTPRILCVTTITKYQDSSISDLDNNFVVYNKITQKETYKWDPNTQKFSILKMEIVKQKKNS